MSHIDDCTKLLQEIEDKLEDAEKLASDCGLEVGQCNEKRQVKRSDLSVAVREMQAKLGVLQGTSVLSPTVDKVQQVKLKF